MTKRTLLILIGVGILVLIAVAFLLVGKPGKINNSVQNTNQPPTSSPATLPTEAISSQRNIQDVEAKIKDSSNSPSSQQAVKEGVDSVDFKDSNGKKIPLVDFEKATKISIVGQLRKYLDSEDYDMYYCPSSGDKKDYAIYFGYDISKGYGDLYPGTVVWMKDWEKTMLPDLRAVLFPDVNFSGEELSQRLQFNDGKYRYTEVHLPDGKTSSINYHISGNGVIISTSPSCLDKLVEIYDPLEP